jgi:hypothetical protein
VRHIARNIRRYPAYCRNKLFKNKVVVSIMTRSAVFKVADYGIVGDAFDVVPRLIEKFKEFKLQQS